MTLLFSHHIVPCFGEEDPKKADRVLAAADQIGKHIEQLSHIHARACLDRPLTDVAMMRGAWQIGEVRGVIPSTVQNRSARIHPLVAIVIHDDRAADRAYVKRNFQKVIVAECTTSAQVAVQPVGRVSNQINRPDGGMAEPHGIFVLQDGKH